MRGHVMSSDRLWLHVVSQACFQRQGANAGWQRPWLISMQACLQRRCRVSTLQIPGKAASYVSRPMTPTPPWVKKQHVRRYTALMLMI